MGARDLSAFEDLPRVVEGRRVTASDVARLHRAKETVWGQIRTHRMREKSEHPSRFSSPADLRLLQDTYGRLDGRCTAMLAALEAQTP